MQGGVTIPPGPDGVATEEVDKNHGRAREDDVNDADVTDDSEVGMRGEAEVEKKHRDLGEDEGGTGDRGGGVAYLMEG